MRLTVKQVIMASHELANGGRAQMDPADYLAVARDVKRQYGYLENWVQEIQAGAPVDNRMEGRAKQYIRAGRTSFLASEAEAMRDRGYLARNVLDARESCAECIAETDKGLVPVGNLSLPGTRICRGNCKCHLAFERAA